MYQGEKRTNFNAVSRLEAKKTYSIYISASTSRNTHHNNNNNTCILRTNRISSPAHAHIHANHPLLDSFPCPIKFHPIISHSSQIHTLAYTRIIHFSLSHGSNKLIHKTSPQSLSIIDLVPEISSVSRPLPHRRRRRRHLQYSFSAGPL